MRLKREIDVRKTGVIQNRYAFVADGIFVETFAPEFKLVHRLLVVVSGSAVARIIIRFIAVDTFNYLIFFDLQLFVDQNREFVERVRGENVVEIRLSARLFVDDEVDGLRAWICADAFLN